MVLLRDVYRVDHVACWADGGFVPFPVCGQIWALNCTSRVVNQLLYFACWWFTLRPDMASMDGMCSCRHFGDVFLSRKLVCAACLILLSDAIIVDSLSPFYDRPAFAPLFNIPTTNIFSLRPTLSLVAVDRINRVCAALSCLHCHH
jgi:hypothetical protein